MSTESNAVQSRGLEAKMWHDPQFQFGVLHFDSKTINDLNEEIDFPSLVQDTAVMATDRRRRYSLFGLESSGQVTLLEHAGFNQPDSFGYARQERTFAPLVTESWRQSDTPQLMKIITTLVHTTNLGAGAIGVHAIRVCSADMRPGLPAPEGLHSDGFDYVGILVCRASTSGAYTRLVRIADATALELGSLSSGELLLFDDRTMLHYTSPFHGEHGRTNLRDVIVFTLRGSSGLES